MEPLLVEATYQAGVLKLDQPLPLDDRITRREIAGSTSLDVVRDVAHRMMTVETMSREGWPAKGIAQRLRKQPAVIQSLSQFRRAVDEIPKLPLGDGCGERRGAAVGLTLSACLRSHAPRVSHRRGPNGIRGAAQLSTAGQWDHGMRRTRHACRIIAGLTACRAQHEALSLARDSR